MKQELNEDGWHTLTGGPSALEDEVRQVLRSLPENKAPENANNATESEHSIKDQTLPTNLENHPVAAFPFKRFANDMRIYKISPGFPFNTVMRKTL